MWFKNPAKQTIFELTNRCNLKCKMCGIWKEQNKYDFNLQTFEKILQGPILKNVQNFSLTGGEPFLLDIKKYYNLIRKYFKKANINISSNGVFKSDIVSFLQSVDDKKISITLSFDGINMHDAIRGQRGLTNNLLKTASTIRDTFPENKLTLKLTISKDNIEDVLSTAKKAKEMNLPLKLKLEEKINCHQSRNNDNEPSNLIPSLEVLKKILELDLDTNRKYIKQLIRKKEGKKTSCNWPTDKIFFSLDGNVFICRKKDSIGNINDENIEKIFSSRKKKEVIQQMKMCKNSQCLSYTHY